ncbi:MAG: ABC transporter permease [Spirochaetia bacterium]|jgi:peptide/nickel transport system permease protein|nr:ABC transporter permease [Spirochaetia bacterium]
MNITYFLTKFARALITMLLVVTFVFVVLRITGDPAQTILPEDTTEEERQEFREMWDLDKPLHVQYLRYWKNLFHGSMGKSYRDKREVSQIMAERLPKTVYLMSLSILLSVIIAIPLGVKAALNRNTFIDRLSMSTAVFGFSMPNFFLGILLILLFSVKLKLLPSSGSDTWKHIILPLITSSVAHIGSYSRFTRSTMLSVMNKPYIRTATATGLSRNSVIYGHALPNAAIPIVTIVGTSIGRIISGSIVIETVFAWPGVGRLLVTSVGSRDMAVVQAIVLFLSISIVTANLAVDILYGFLDPRIRTRKGGK